MYEKNVEIIKRITKLVLGLLMIYTLIALTLLPRAGEIRCSKFHVYEIFYPVVPLACLLNTSVGYNNHDKRR